MPSINTCKKIVLVGNNPANTNDVKDIQKVVYCDDDGLQHTVWPCMAHLTNVYLVELKIGQMSDIATAYTIDTTTNTPNVFLKPGVAYAVKGDIQIYREPGVLEKTIQNCYFMPETTNWLGPIQDITPVSSSDKYNFGDRVATDGTNTYSVGQNYGAWAADDSLGQGDGLSLQLGWWNYDISAYVQNGYIFDSNYVTPIILKKDRIYEEGGVFDENNNAISTSSINLSVGDTLTVIPKVRKSGTSTDYVTQWSNSTWTLSSGSWYSISTNNGLYTIEITDTPSGNYGAITFTSANGTIITLNIIVAPDYDYRVKIGGSLPSGTMSISQQTNVTVEYKNHNEQWPSNPSILSPSDYVVQSSNSNIIDVVNSNKIRPVGTIGDSAVISVTVNGDSQPLGQYTVSVGGYSAYVSIHDFGSTGTIEQVTNYLSTSVTSSNPKMFDFYGDSSGSAGMSVYLSPKPNGCELSGTDTWTLAVTSSASLPSSADINVYTKQGGAQLGKITVTFNVTN